MKLKVLVITFIISLVISFYLVEKYCNSESTFSHQISDIKLQLNKYKEQEQQEKIRAFELQVLQDPQIIISELNQVGKLIVYEGQSNYEDYIVESNFWGSRTINLNLKYNFGISIELSRIKVKEIYNKTVILNIPKQEFKIEYVELDNKSKLESNKEWFISQYQPEDIKIIFNQANDKVRWKILNDKSIFEKSYESLENNLRELVLKLGYEDVKFEEID
jgi:hypothetical protein